MGYVRNRTFLLAFDDPDLKGLEITARAASAGQVMEVLEGLSLLDRNEGFTAEHKRVVDRMFRVFAGCPKSCDWDHEEQGGNHYVSKIKAWNLEEEDGSAVPPTYTGLMSQDLEFVQDLVKGWMDGQIGTPGDLGKDSNAGGPSAEESIPMEPLWDGPPS